jgi:hypothetical protein
MSPTCDGIPINRPGDSKPAGHIFSEDLDGGAMANSAGDEQMFLLVTAWVIRTNEESMIARHTRRLLDAALTQ